MTECIRFCAYTVIIDHELALPDLLHYILVERMEIKIGWRSPEIHNKYTLELNISKSEEVLKFEKVKALTDIKKDLCFPPTYIFAISLC